jgi:hypothetical protein
MNPDVDTVPQRAGYPRRVPLDNAGLAATPAISFAGVPARASVKN